MTKAFDISQGEFSGDLTVDTNTFYVDSTNNRVGIGTSSPGAALDVVGQSTLLRLYDGVNVASGKLSQSGDVITLSQAGTSAGALAFATGSGALGSEAMRIDSSGNLLVGSSSLVPISTTTVTGINAYGDGVLVATRDSGVVQYLNRLSSDGTIASIRAQGAEEGSISVSGTTVSYTGGHLSRWSRLPDGTDDTHIYKGTVMTNLDEMCEWRDEHGDLEDNEQLNKTTVSAQEGDPNVAGLFVAWDEDDDWGDYYLAMTGDLVIRIAQGVTVQRGDLLMSAGDGTAKPQGDDIVRSKTVAKVTSTNVSHTYPDGSYAVPCVVMAC